MGISEFVFAALGVVTAFGALYYAGRQSSAGLKASRQAEKDRAVADAIAPISRELSQVTLELNRQITAALADMHYWRDRCAAFETELRRRG